MKQESIHRNLVKFRVWDGIMFMEPNIANPFNFIEDGNKYEIYVAGDRVIQQYTGLKDKYGKEIYEGDLINFTIQGFAHEAYPEDIKSAEVWYNPKDACFCFGRYKTNDFIDYYFSMADRIDLKTMEIVGNIFEKNEKI